MTLQQQFNLIKEGKGDKAQFLKHAKQLFPQYFNQYTSYDNAVSTLKSKQIISEAAGGVVGKGFDIYDWKKILGEEVKASEKETSKEVLDAQAHAYDNKDMKNADNVNFNEIMKGFYAELKDEKNKEKSGDEIKAMVVKNLAKDPLYYTKNGEFGTKGVGYTTEAPGLGEPKEPKGKYKSSGYGDLGTKTEKVKANVQDSLGDKEAKTSDPKKVKEMEVTPKGASGVKRMPMPGVEKKMKLQEYSVYQGDVSKIKPEPTPKDGEVYLKDLKAGDKFSVGKSEYVVVKPEMNGSGVEVTYADGTGNMKFKGSAIVKLTLREEMVGGVNYDSVLAAELKQIVGSLDKLTPYVLELGNKVEEDSSGKIHVYEDGKKVKIFANIDEFLKGIKARPTKLQENTDMLDQYLSIIDSNNMSEDEAYGFLEDEGLTSSQISSIMNYAFPIKADKDIPFQGMSEGEKKLRSLIQQIIKEELNDINEASIETDLFSKDIYADADKKKIYISPKLAKSLGSSYFSKGRSSYERTRSNLDIDKEAYLKIDQGFRSILRKGLKGASVTQLPVKNSMGDYNWVALSFPEKDYEIKIGLDKITINKRELQEELNEENQNDPSYDDPSYIANYIAGEFTDYIIPGSEKFTYGPDEEGTYHLEFLLGFDDLSYNTPEEEEEELQSQIGGSSSRGPGQAFSRTNVSYEGEKNGKYIFSIHQRGGYDI